MTNAERTARKQVGDGKLPNLYWVSTDYSWLEMVDGCFESALEVHPELDKLPKPKTETFGPFTTFQEALDKAEELIQEEVTEPDGRTLGIHGVNIEDRISGTIWDATYYVAKSQKGILSDDFNRV